jgi:Asp-tRNA(Asn)/Glu-tRNA(Gln) amidotransferase A subunit family amidase
VCKQFRADVEAAMAGWDAVLLPATASVAPLLGQPGAATEPLTRFTRPFNATGQPVVVVPVPECRLPVGIQIVGRAGEDAALVRVATAVEQAWQR